MLLLRSVTGILLLLGATAARAQWTSSAHESGVVYFGAGFPSRIERFDTASRAFLPTIPLSGFPVSIAVDGPDLYVCFGSDVVRVSPAAGETPLFRSTVNCRDLFVDGSYVVVAGFGGTFVTADKATGRIVDSDRFFYSTRGHSISRELGRVFGRSLNVNPPDIVAVLLGTSGLLVSQIGSPQHGDLPDAARTWVVPGGAEVIDDAGIVYRAADLLFVRSLGGPVDDLAFRGSLPVARRGNTLVAFDERFLDSGRLSLAAEAQEIVIEDSTLFAFHPGASRIEFEEVDLDLLVAPPPGKPVSPLGLAYVPDRIDLGEDGIVYLLSSEHRSIFRWDARRGEYASTIPLAEAPDLMAISDANRTIYLAYPGGRLTQLSMDGPFEERGFVNSPQSPCGLATAGAVVFVCDPSFSNSHYTYHADGGRLSHKESPFTQISQEYVWSPANRKLYFFRDSIFPNDLLWEELLPDGTLGAAKDSPFHGGLTWEHPIRVHPDGSVVALGSGRIHHAITLDLVATLPFTIKDAAWFEGALQVLRDAGPYSLVQTLLPDYTPGPGFLVPGTPYALFAQSDGLLVVTDVGGMPRFDRRAPGAGDLDGDEVPDHADNCPGGRNPDQTDTDGDGVGDACNDALDRDRDDWADALDNCEDVANPAQEDRDADGIGDACNDALDRDGDEIADALDRCPDLPDPEQADGDEDGLGDACDPYPDNPDNEQAACDEAKLLVVALRADLDACLAAPICPDGDGDGECDPNDRCPGTPEGVPVDESGCSRLQFCSGFESSDQRGPDLCARLDWRNDESGVNLPRDCERPRRSGAGNGCRPAD